MKKMIFGAMMLSGAVAFAQTTTGKVGINTTEPKATLDIKAKNPDGSSVEGLLIPRVDRAAAKTMGGANTKPEKSTLIYVNSVSNGDQKDSTIRVDSVGFYYFDGNIWQKIVDTNLPDTDPTTNQATTNTTTHAEHATRQDKVLVIGKDGTVKKMKQEPFYLPPVLLDTADNTQKTLDLYKEYKKYGDAAGTGVYADGQLEFKLLYFDNTAFTASITGNNLTYTKIGNITPKSFMTILCVPKY